MALVGERSGCLLVPGPVAAAHGVPAQLVARLPARDVLGGDDAHLALGVRVVSRTLDADLWRENKGCKFLVSIDS